MMIIGHFDWLPIFKHHLMFNIEIPTSSCAAYFDKYEHDKLLVFWLGPFVNQR
jgi:hypothetical protein